VVITPRHVRVGLRSFGGRNYLVRRISRRMFFGFEMLRYYDFWIPVSDVEKTLIDFAYFREPLDAGALREIKVRLRKEVLSEYLKRCPKFVAKRVLELLRQG
jgi:predicted transcriptional regulator of viral defense system